LELDRDVKNAATGVMGRARKGFACFRHTYDRELTRWKKGNERTLAASEFLSGSGEGESTKITVLLVLVMLGQYIVSLQDRLQGYSTQATR
jgi:hypothetical protein